MAQPENKLRKVMLIKPHYKSGSVGVYEVMVYKHVNGTWIPKYHVTEPDLEEMQENPFIQTIRIFTEEEWRQLQEDAQKSGVKLSALLDGYP